MSDLKKAMEYATKLMMLHECSDHGHQGMCDALGDHASEIDTEFRKSMECLWK